jgi:hypothetical protein
MRQLPSSAASATGILATGIVHKELDREQREAEVEDPYALGWDAGEDLDDPPPCPYLGDGIKARLWRKGFAARVDAHIAAAKRSGGLAAVV